MNKILITLLLLIPSLVKADLDKNKEDLSFLCENQYWNNPMTINIFLDEGYVEIPDEEYDKVYRYNFNYSRKIWISFLSILDVENYYHENTKYLNLLTGTLQGITRERINGELDDGELVTYDEECINLTFEKENETIEANISKDKDRYLGKSAELIKIPVRLCYSYASGGCKDWHLRGEIYFTFSGDEVIRFFFILPFEKYDGQNYDEIRINRDDLLCRMDEIYKAEDWIEIALKNDVDIEKTINEEHIGCAVYPKLIFKKVKGYTPKVGFNFSITDPDYSATIWIRYDEFLEYKDFLFNTITDLAEEAKKIIDAEIEVDQLFN